ncbi:MAG: lamin tail domain-containing protein [bacterium]
MKNLPVLKLTFIILIMIGMHLHPDFVRADSLDVCINEIAWMGTKASSTDEWIELYNNTDTDLDLTNCTLTAEDGSPEITLSHSIKAKSYFLLERSDDNTVSAIEADIIYTGSLGNTGEHLILRDSTDTVMDRVNCSEGWFAGDNSNKISMERISPVISGSDSANWNSNNGLTINGIDADATPIQGTPGKQNSVYESQASIKASFSLPERIHNIYNYPNPFNPSTRIHCNLSAENNINQISINIFNLRGQKVRTLINRKQVQGDYSLVWDGLDDRGRDLPSGIYFLHLYSKNRIIETAKMVKLK